MVEVKAQWLGQCCCMGQRCGVGEVNLSQYRGCKCEQPGFSWE